MASSIQILRSTTANERPFPGSLLEGQPAVNVNSTEPGLFFKASDGSLIKIGPAAITSDGAPPNTGGVGQQGNCVGELWLDKSLNPPVLKVYDGSQWIDAGSGGGGGSSEFVRWVYTSVGGETSLSGTSGGVLLEYVPGLEEVFINGVLITRGVDYSAVNGSSITNLAPLTAGDVVTVISDIPDSIVTLPGQADISRWTILATAGQTVLAGVDTNGESLNYVAGLEQVFVNGAFLREGVDYTTTNANTIALTAPLNLGDEVTVLIFTPFTVGSTPATSITFAQTNSTVTRSVQAKLTESVSVKDFGATGDGSTDDTAFVQAAFDSGAAEIYFPPSIGKYLLGEIFVPSTTRRVFGPGIIRQYQTDAGIFRIANSSGCVFDSLSIEGAWGSSLAVQPNSNNFGIRATTCSNIVVRNCSFYRIGFIPVWLRDCEDSLVHGNSLFECGPGIYLRGSRRVRISSNNVRQPITNDSVFTIGISVESTDGHAFGVSRDVTIEGNIVQNYKNAQGIMAHAGYNLAIIGNVVDQSVIGISLNPFNGFDFISGAQIVGNTVEGPLSLPGYSGGNDGIICQAGPGTPDIVGVTISGNTVINYNRHEGGAAQGGIRLGWTDRVSVSGNIVTGTQCNGIVLTSNEEAVSISGNSISNVVAGGTQNGILCMASPRGIISGNIFDDIAGASGIGVAFTVATGVRLGDNHFRNVTTYVSNGQHEQEILSKTITAVGPSVSVDLSGVDVIIFDQASPSTVSSFTGVVPFKLYKFYFNNGNTTINRDNAYLDGGTNKTGSAYDVMLVMGRTTSTIAQAAPLSVNN